MTKQKAFFDSERARPDGKYPITLELPSGSKAYLTSDEAEAYIYDLAEAVRNYEDWIEDVRNAG